LSLLFRSQQDLSVPYRGRRRNDEDELLSDKYGQGRALVVLQSYDKAQHVLEEVVATRRQKQPLKKLALSYALNELGNLHILQGKDFGEIIYPLLYKESAQLKNDILGADHPEVLGTTQNYALSLARSGSLVLASEVLQDCVLKVQRDLHASKSNDLKLANTLEILSTICRKLDRLSKALDYCVEALQSW
jgi:hypothetical protein